MPEPKRVIETNDINRPPKHLIEGIRAMGAATASSTLFHMADITNSHIVGPVTHAPGTCIAGPALTLQFMPKREDMYSSAEYDEPELQLHRHVLYHTQPGDIVVVDARADMRAGVFGEMMLTYFKGRGGAGVVIDGCLRDWPNIKTLDIPCWIRGVTPNFHTQIDLMPFAVNGPIACGGCLVMPGDIIVADDDGAVVVPAHLAERLIKEAHVAHGWEDFSRERLSQGGDLRRYYPLTDAARPEYEAWLAARAKKGD
ncbi:MAG: ribonuclease activity regulator RraA [Inquilinaceae bacterium]